MGNLRSKLVIVIHTVKPVKMKTKLSEIHVIYNGRNDTEKYRVAGLISLKNEMRYKHRMFLGKRDLVERHEIHFASSKQHPIKDCLRWNEEAR